MACISLLLVWRLLPETLPRNRRLRLGFAGLIAPLRRASCASAQFFIHATIGSFAMFGLFAYISGSPPVYIGRYGLSASACGALVGVCSAGFILGSQLNPRLIARFGMGAIAARRRCARSSAPPCCSRASPSPAASGCGAWLLPILIATTSMGLVLPNATVGALSRQARQCRQRVGRDGHGAIYAGRDRRFGHGRLDRRHGPADGGADADRRSVRDVCRLRRPHIEGALA